MISFCEHGSSFPNVSERTTHFLLNVNSQNRHYNDPRIEFMLNLRDKLRKMEPGIAGAHEVAASECKHICFHCEPRPIICRNGHQKLVTKMNKRLRRAINEQNRE